VPKYRSCHWPVMPNYTVVAVGRQWVLGHEHRLGVPEEGGQILAVNNDRAGADAGAAPADADASTGSAIGEQGLNIVPLPCDKRDRIGLLRVVFVPFIRCSPAFHACDLGGVGGVLISAQVQFAVVVAVDPERVFARLGRVHVATAASTVVVFVGLLGLKTLRPLAFMRYPGLKIRMGLERVKLVVDSAAVPKLKQNVALARVVSDGGNCQSDEGKANNQIRPLVVHRVHPSRENQITRSSDAPGPLRLPAFVQQPMCVRRRNGAGLICG